MYEQKRQLMIVKICVGFLAIVMLCLVQIGSVTASPGQDCMFKVGGECGEIVIDFDKNPQIILSRYLVVGYDDNGCMYVDSALFWLASVDVFDSVADPVRFHNNDIYKYVQQVVIKPRGEVRESDVQDAINKGDAFELPNSRIRIATLCDDQIEEITDIPVWEEIWKPGPPPYEMTKLDIGEMGGYGLLHELEGDYLSDDVPVGELELFGEETAVSILLIHKNDVSFVEETLTQK